MARPVHISELCSALMVSRRTLHRAFFETLGTGPMTYLRLRRLSAVHRALRMPGSSQASVTHTALDHGFSDLGRFAVYYRSIFGESPSQTRRRAVASSEDFRSHEDDFDDVSAKQWSNSGGFASALP
ncbi:helix-turn-helix transcriptional regulator [Borborobacter arsenicus]